MYSLSVGPFFVWAGKITGFVESPFPAASPGAVSLLLLGLLSMPHLVTLALTW